MIHLRKPIQRVVRARVPHGVNDHLVVTLRPDGTLSLRELRQKHEETFCLGSLYVQRIVTRFPSR